MQEVEGRLSALSTLHLRTLSFEGGGAALCTLSLEGGKLPGAQALARWKGLNLVRALAFLPVLQSGSCLMHLPLHLYDTSCGRTSSLGALGMGCIWIYEFVWYKKYMEIWILGDGLSIYIYPDRFSCHFR